MGVLEAVILGIVQGLTEFLPISSSGHLLLVPVVFGWPDPGAGFTAVIQIGTLLAVLIYFWRDLVRVAGALFRWEKGTSDFRLGVAIVVGTIPISIIGMLLEEQIDTVFRAAVVVACTLLIGAALMALGELIGKRTREVEQVRPMDGLWVGFFQALALVPGMSRSGSTIAGAMLLGFERADAARLSFMLSVPAVALSGFYKLYSDRSELFEVGVAPVMIATLAAFISGYAAIAFLIGFLQMHSTFVFIAYRVVLAAVILALIWQGAIA